jgi:transposase-like protein
MEPSKRRDRWSYTPEFETEIVGRCRAGDRSIAEVARDFDLTAWQYAGGWPRPRSTPVSVPA